MSFSFTLPETPISEIGAAIVTATPEGLSDATLETVAAVLTAAQSLVDSGVLGTDRVCGSFSGHANPDHVPTAGWANDCVTISLTAIGAPPE